MEYGFAGRPEPAPVAAPLEPSAHHRPPPRGIRRSPRVNQEQDQITESDLEPSRAARIADSALPVQPGLARKVRAHIARYGMPYTPTKLADWSGLQGVG